MSESFDLAALEAATRGHTPEPWEVTAGRVYAASQEVAYVDDCHEEIQPYVVRSRKAVNARLIAAAPALLRECRRLTEALKRADLALQSLTPGGSEFVNDPERCVAFVQQMRAADHEIIKRRTVDVNRLTARIAELEAAQVWVPVAERLLRESWPAATTAQPSGDPADDYAKATATRKVIGRMVPDAARECVYTEDEDGVWECSACGFLLSLSDGSPDDNNYAYCPHCGARITESRAYVEDDDGTE